MRQVRAAQRVVALYPPDEISDIGRPLYGSEVGGEVRSSILVRPVVLACEEPLATRVRGRERRTDDEPFLGGGGERNLGVYESEVAGVAVVGHGADGGDVETG